MSAPVFEDIRTILLATDFSDRTTRAESFALDLARKCDATLMLAHGIEPIMGVDQADADEFEEFYDRLLTRAESEIERRLEAWEPFHITVKHHVQIGPRWQVILEHANEEDVDCIVLGRRPYRAGRRVPLGTTSQKVFFGTTRPVLFVPHEAE